MDTFLLTISSIRDVLFSQRSAQTGLQVRPGLAVGMEPFIERRRNLVPVMFEDQDAMNGATNDWNERNIQVSGYESQFAEHVIKAMGSNATPRLRKVMRSLIRHLHDFCQHNDITVDEYMAAIKMINEAGRISDHGPNQGELSTDDLGLDSSVARCLRSLLVKM